MFTKDEGNPFLSCRAHLTHSLISITCVILVPGLTHVPHTPNNGANKATLQRATLTHVILHTQHAHKIQANLQAPAIPHRKKPVTPRQRSLSSCLCSQKPARKQNLFGESCRCQVRQNICQGYNTYFAFLLLHITSPLPPAPPSHTASKQAQHTSQTLH